MRKIFLLLATLLVLTSVASAAKVDMYRDALLNKSFTLKYEVVEVPIVETSHDAIFTGRGLRNKEVKDIFDYLHKGIIVVDGDNRYVEVAHDDYVTTSRNRVMTVSNKIPEGGICHLVKDGETFNFFWNKKDGKRRYFGGYTMFGGLSRSVKANDETKMQTPYQRLVEEYNFGTPELALALTAILPPEKIIATPQTPAYKFFASGTLDNGLTYEDFVSDKGDTFSAVRYYFDGDKMVKVAMATYIRNGGKILSYSKSVINITEFSTTPDQNYLQLPAELKDKTKRKR